MSDDVNVDDNGVEFPVMTTLTEGYQSTIVLKMPS